VKKLLAPILLALVSACTPGGAGLGGGGGTVPITGKIVTINVSLTLYSLTQTPAGPALGYSPEVTSVNVGDGIKFFNQDSFSNTATLIPNATTYPAASPFGFSATKQSGNALSRGWSSGALTQSGSTSQTIAVDQAGTFLYGCFFHYSGGMRGEIIAK
jgi:plastocyanin